MRLSIANTDDVTQAHDKNSQKVKADVDALVGEAGQFDDAATTRIQLNEMESKMLTVTPTMETMPQVAAFVEEHLEKFDVPMGLSTKLMIALDEIYSNIVRYSGAAEAQICLEKAEDAVKLIFSDNGKPYNPLNAEEPDLTATAKERSIGGLGIFMVRKMMDDVEYEYTHGRNLLTLSKKLQQ